VLEGTKRWHEARGEGRTHVRPPGFVERRKYRSFTFPEYGNGCRIQNGRLLVSGVGWVRMHDHRKVKGSKKTVTVKWAQGRWWCIVIAMVQPNDLFLEAREGTEDRGGDPGLMHLLTLSDGTVYDPPKAWHEMRARLAHEQRILSRKFEAREKAYEEIVAEMRARGETPPRLRDVPYSNRLKAQIVKVAKLHTKVENVRDHHHKKIAAILRDTVKRLAMEEHGVQFMIRNCKQAKSASDRAIHAFKHAVATALGPSRYIPTANKRQGIGGNSQSCVCGQAVPKELSDRVHRCDACGLEGPRDVVSANIVQLIAFGTVSETLDRMVPAGGQPVVRRRGGEAGTGESTAGGSDQGPTAEFPSKRRSQKTSPKRPRVGNLPRQARPVSIGVPQGAALAPEPPSRSSIRKPQGTSRTEVGTS